MMRSEDALHARMIFRKEKGRKEGSQRNDGKKGQRTKYAIVQE